MSVQVIQNNPHHLGLRVGLVHQPPHLVGEVLPCPSLGDGPRASSPATVHRSGTGCACPPFGTHSPVAGVVPAKPGEGAVARSAAESMSRRNRPLADWGHRAQHTSPGRPPWLPQTRHSPQEYTTPSSATA